MSTSSLSANNQKGFTQVIILIAGVLIISLGGYLLFTHYPTYFNNKKLEVNKGKENNYPKTQNSLIWQQVFVTEISNFDTDNIPILPDLHDLRNAFLYQGKYIVVGYKSIFEYDPNLQKFTRIGNMSVIEGGNSAEKIGNYLYVVNYGTFSGMCPPNEVCLKDEKIASKIYKINIDSGIIENVYFGQKEKNLELIDLNLRVDGNNLLASFSEGVAIINTLTDQINLYTAKEIGCDGCLIYGFYKNSDNNYIVRAHVKPTDPEIYFVFNQQQNKWLPIENPPLSSLENQDKVSVDKISKELPEFFGTSQLVINRYYIFANGVIYTLEKGGLPKVYKRIKIPLPSGYTRIVLVDNDERYALILGMNASSLPLPGWPKQEPLFAELVNLQTFTSTDLLAKNADYQKLVKTKNFTEKIELTLTNAKPEITDSEFRLNDRASGELKLMCNFIEKKLVFSESLLTDIQK